MFLIDLLEEGSLFVIIVDGEIAVKGQMSGFYSQDTAADRVKGAHPEALHREFEQLFQTVLQLSGCFICEGDHQDVPGMHVPFPHQVGTAVDDGFGLAAARSGKHQDRLVCGGDHPKLLGIQFFLVINHKHITELPCGNAVPLPSCLDQGLTLTKILSE